MAKFYTRPVYFLNKHESEATCVGNNAGWLCLCRLPLVGPHEDIYKIDECPRCGRYFRIRRGTKPFYVNFVEEVEMNQHYCPKCGGALRYVADEPTTKRLICHPRGCHTEFEIGRGSVSHADGSPVRALFELAGGTRTKEYLLDPTTEADLPELGD